MPYRPIEYYQKSKVISKPALARSTVNYSQHGDLCILLDLPNESLTHITSFLDPPSLLILSRVCKPLFRHVGDDNTWRRAFVYHYFGVSPESDAYDVNRLLLRRFEITWRNEFIFRFILSRRWESSRNGEITHVPCNSSISSMHIMPSHALLTSYLQFGIVSRSFALTGKVLRGFLDAWGNPPNGNPDLDFAPNVSVNAVTSDGGNARILWGCFDGEVLFTTANKVMEVGGKVGARLVRCTFEDQHDGAVTDAAWGKGGGGNTLTTAVTGGTDGRVKLWDAKHGRCLWTSDRATDPSVPDPCVKVVLEADIVAGAMKSGNIRVWSVFLDEASASTITSIQITSPIPNDKISPLAALYVDCTSTKASLLLFYEHHLYFYRVDVDTTTHAVDVSRFGDPTSGSITALLPCFAQEEGHSSFVIVGDQLGYVSIYDWKASSGSPPTHKFEASSNLLSITALAWNGAVLCTGSAQGTVGVYHALTFRRLRECVVNRRGADGEEDDSVKQIVLGPEKDMFAAAIGKRIVAWRAGGSAKERSGIKRKHAALKKAKKDKAAAAKYHQLQELQDTISESRLELEEEHEYVVRAFGREKEQREQLEHLGLSEAEAVEYVLMLSRDEAERAGVFEGDFDQGPTGAASPPPHGLPTCDAPSDGMAPAMEAGSSSGSASVSPDDVVHFPPMGGGSPDASSGKTGGGQSKSVKSVWGNSKRREDAS